MSLFFKLRLRLLAWRRLGLIPPPALDMRVLSVLATTDGELSAIDIRRAMGGLRRPSLASILSALRDLESLGTVVCREQDGAPWQAQPPELRYLWSDAVTSGRSERWRRPLRRCDMALS